MSRYHHLVDVHSDNADLIASKLQVIADAIEAGDLDSAKNHTLKLHDQVARMEMAFEEMSLLVRVLMLEFQAGDDAKRPSRLSNPRSQPPASSQQAVQLELFALLTEIQTKRRTGA